MSKSIVHDPQAKQSKNSVKVRVIITAVKEVKEPSPIKQRRKHRLRRIEVLIHSHPTNP